MVTPCPIMVAAAAPARDHSKCQTKSQSKNILVKNPQIMAVIAKREPPRLRIIGTKPVPKI